MELISHKFHAVFLSIKEVDWITPEVSDCILALSRNVFSVLSEFHSSISPCLEYWCSGFNITPLLAWAWIRIYIVMGTDPNIMLHVRRSKFDAVSCFVGPMWFHRKIWVEEVSEWLTGSVSELCHRNTHLVIWLTCWSGIFAARSRMPFGM